MPLVTIAWQYGSLGDEIGQDVAQKLGVRYVDREIINAVALRMGTPEQVVADIEDKSPSFAKRVADAVIQAFADGSRLAPLTGVVPPPILSPTGEALAEDDEPQVFTFDVNDGVYLNFVRQVVRDIAAAGDAVIAGRATHLLLHDVASALHVHVVAPFEVRVERIMEERACSREAADKLARDADHARESYTSRFYHSRWSDPTQYHLTLNTGLLTAAEARDLIISAAGQIRRAPGSVPA
ncbi:MAG TPA: cytidylate kinase-like family protein [Chloroflexota bacterium]|jgi:hypothetical protein|nr:cytidylate kinase-like family protein [Chloroflexota bacterium]